MLEKIIETESKLFANDALFIYSANLCYFHLWEQVYQLFPQRNVYWCLQGEASNIQKNFQQYLPQNKSFWNGNFSHLINQQGLSFYSLNQRTQVWCFPANYTDLNQHIDLEKVCFLTNSIKEISNLKIKPWFQFPNIKTRPKTVGIIGAGIAGALTARLLAEQNIEVIVLEKKQVAHAASGNQQGLLYAKISAFDTVQSQLLLASYGLSLSFVKLFNSDCSSWADCGVLHLDFNDEEKKRNQQLAQDNNQLYLYQNIETASQTAGIKLSSGGLFWPYGAWLYPRAYIQQLLAHQNIQLMTDYEVQDFNYDGQWHITANKKALAVDVLVLCQGADSVQFADKLGLNFSQIRGQTSITHASDYSSQLKIALSGQSYISPAWKNQHCFGASFHPNNNDTNWSIADEEENWQGLLNLDKNLCHSLNNKKDAQLRGHSALRCDAYDHLPVVGQVGDVRLMREIYAKLALDKNYRLNAACPFVPNLLINTAHGSRGLATTALSSLSIVAEILNLPQPLNQQLRTALSPNRMIIRDIVRRTR